MLNISPYLCVSQMFRTCFWDQSCFWVQFLHWTRPITRSKQEVVFYGFCPGFWHPSVQPSFAHECQFGPCFNSQGSLFWNQTSPLQGDFPLPFFSWECFCMFLSQAPLGCSCSAHLTVPGHHSECPAWRWLDGDAGMASGYPTNQWVASGKHAKNYGKSQLLMGKSTIASINGDFP